jgi:hypothetical protein
MKCLPLLLLSFALIGCHNEISPEGFSIERFRTVAKGDSIETVEKKTGRPVRCIVYELEPHKGKVFGGKQFLEIAFEQVRDWAHESRVMVTLEYSIQDNQLRDYTYRFIDMREGKAANVVETFITE